MLDKILLGIAGIIMAGGVLLMVAIIGFLVMFGVARCLVE